MTAYTNFNDVLSSESQKRLLSYAPNFLIDVSNSQIPSNLTSTKNETGHSSSIFQAESPLDTFMLLRTAENARTGRPTPLLPIAMVPPRMYFFVLFFDLGTTFPFAKLFHSPDRFNEFCFLLDIFLFI